MSGTDEEPGASGEVPDLDATAESSEPSSDSAAFHSQAYSAPESEQFTGPYVPYDEYVEEYEDELPPPRWPWVVGVAAIIAAITLVASVALLVAGRSDQTNGAARSSTVTPTPTTTPWNEIIPTTTPSPSPPPPPPPSPSPEEPPPPPPPPPEPEPEPVPEPVPAPHEEPPPTPSPTPTPTPTPSPTPTPTPKGPRQITYTVTGNKVPLDRISITWADGTGRTRVNPNVNIPWSITVTPISNSEIGSVSATSFLRLSQLNCTITTSDGQVLSSNSNNSPQATC